MGRMAFTYMLLELEPGRKGNELAVRLRTHVPRLVVDTQVLLAFGICGESTRAAWVCAGKWVGVLGIGVNFSQVLPEVLALGKETIAFGAPVQTRGCATTDLF